MQLDPHSSIDPEWDRSNQQSIQGTLNIGEFARCVVAGLDNRLFVQTRASSGRQAIRQVDATNGASRGPEILGSGGGIYGGELQISPDRKALYYGNFGVSPSWLYKVDVSTTTPTLLLLTRDAGSNGQQLVLSHDGSMIAYVCGVSSSGYAIPNRSTTDFTTKGDFETGAYPNAFAYSPDDRIAYALHSPYPTAIDIYDTSTYALIGQFAAMDFGSSMVVDQSGQHLFVSHGEGYFGVQNLVIYAVPETDSEVLATIGFTYMFLVFRRRCKIPSQLEYRVN